MEQMEILRQLSELEAAGVIGIKGKSNYAAPTFVVKKPGGKYRLMVNYAELNKNMINDMFHSHVLTPFWIPWRGEQSIFRTWILIKLFLRYP